MNNVYMLIIALGAIFFLWFGIPFLMKNIINIGNVTGMILSALLCGYGFQHAKVHAWIAQFWQKEFGKIMVVGILLITVSVAVTVVVLTVAMIWVAVSAPPENVTAIVLGCKVNGQRPSRVLQERLDTAYEYLTANPKCYCVLSGGQGEDEDISEAECMYQYMLKKGISEERLLLEDKSTNTRENLLYSQILLKEQGLSGEVTIITSEFHAYRAHREAKWLGIKSYSTPSSTFFVYLPTYYVRELYGILWAELKKYNNF